MDHEGWHNALSWKVTGKKEARLTDANAMFLSILQLISLKYIIFDIALAVVQDV